MKTIHTIQNITIKKPFEKTLLLLGYSMLSEMDSLTLKKFFHSVLTDFTNGKVSPDELSEITNQILQIKTLTEEEYSFYLPFAEVEYYWRSNSVIDISRILVTGLKHLTSFTDTSFKLTKNSFIVLGDTAAYYEIRGITGDKPLSKKTILKLVHSLIGAFFTGSVLIKDFSLFAEDLIHRIYKTGFSNDTVLNSYYSILKSIRSLYSVVLSMDVKAAQEVRDQISSMLEKDEPGDFEQFFPKSLYYMSYPGKVQLQVLSDSIATSQCSQQSLSEAEIFYKNYLLFQNDAQFEDIFFIDDYQELLPEEFVSKLEEISKVLELP